MMQAPTEPVRAHCRSASSRAADRFSAAASSVYPAGISQINLAPLPLPRLVEDAGEGLLGKLRAKDIEGGLHLGMQQDCGQRRSKRLGFCGPAAQRLGQRPDQDGIPLRRLNLDAHQTPRRRGRRWVRVALRWDLLTISLPLSSDRTRAWPAPPRPCRSRNSARSAPKPPRRCWGRCRSGRSWPRPGTAHPPWSP